MENMAIEIVFTYPLKLWWFSIAMLVTSALINGDVPIGNMVIFHSYVSDLPMKNGDLPIENMVIFQ